MADYNRFVAYIYEYVNGRKSKNAGFAKIESRNGICRMQVHIQNVIPADGKLEIFGFVRENGGLPAVPLGEGQVQNGSLDRRLTTPEEAMGGSGYTFSQIKGIWVRSESGRNWVTVFDDEPVEIERLGKAEKPKKPLSEDTQMQTDRTSDEERKVEEELPGKIEESSEAEISGEAEEAKQGVEAMRDKETEQGREAKQNAEAERDTETAQDRETERNAEAERDTGAAQDRETEQDREAVQGRETGQNRETTQSAEAERAIETEQNIEKQGTKQEQVRELEAAAQKEEEKKEEEKKRETEKKEEKAKEKTKSECAPGSDRRWNCVTARYPHFQPVRDDSIEDAIRIQPSDLRTLWQKGWRQGNNSFLMHGYYQYRHLMLGKCRDGGYVLGVPGLYEEQEQNMAKMFGFPEFKPAREQGSTGQFGYWCRNLIP